MSKKNIAILVTTFLRDAMMYKTIQSIIDNFPDNCKLFIADQGYQTDEKTITYDYFKSQIPCEIHYLPFDCGLSYARNFLVNKANELGFQYCMISSDSIQFTGKYNFNNIIELLESNKEYALCGFELENSVCPWEFDIDVKPDGIHLLPSIDTVSFEEKTYKIVEICRNIFLAKTDVLLKNNWDNELKLGEHEKFFIDLKQINCKVLWTDSIKFRKNNMGGSEEYRVYRKRLEFYLKLLKHKLNIEKWVIYSPEVMKEIKDYQHKPKGKK